MVFEMTPIMPRHFVIWQSGKTNVELIVYNVELWNTMVDIRLADDFMLKTENDLQGVKVGNGKGKQTQTFVIV